MPITLNFGRLDMSNIDLALNTTTPETLERLSNDEDWKVRLEVANNPNTPTETLERLANDDDWVIRWYLATNPNTPPKALERLANDKSYYVRCGVAKNPNTPQYIKTYLKINEFLNRYE